MGPRTRNRRVRHAGAGTLITLLACGTCTGAANAPDYCIVSHNAIGCQSERAIAEITTIAGNTDELAGTIETKLASGICRLFDYGDRVYVTGTRGRERTAVRRPGDEQSWWMPASWSRPASECAANATPQSLEHKLGLDLPTVSSNFSSLLSARTGSLRNSAIPCVFKPVMTDAEIAACRGRH